MVNKQQAQKWLEEKYKDEAKKDTTIIEKKFNEDIELEGELIIDGYPNLKKIFLSSTRGITKLTITNCSEVEVIFVNDNQITQIVGLENLTKLKKLNFGNNKIEEIDVSKNYELEMLNLRENPIDFNPASDLKKLISLRLWNSEKTISLGILLEQVSAENFKKVAEGLKLNVKDKEIVDMEEMVDQEIGKINSNKQLLADHLPGLLDKGEIDEDKLEEIEANVEQIKELVTKNTPELVTDGKIDQVKINGLKDANKNAKTAMNELGVGDLKTDTLKNLLGDSKLTDIPKPKTLTDLLAENKNLEEIVKAAGIDPQDNEAKQKAEDLKRLKDVANKLGINSVDGLEEGIKRYFGTDFKERLEVQEYYNQVEINNK